MQITRRAWTAGALASRGWAAPARTTMGVASTSFMTAKRPKDTLEFLEYCHGLGAGGIQIVLSSLEPAYLRRLRARLEETGMYFEAMCGLPRQDAAAFEAQLAAAREAGALCARAACLGGRRYETFSTLEAWKQFVADSQAAVARAVPLAEKHRVKLALENHKDWTGEEFVKLLERHPSEYFGVCLDTGNNISLLDDPAELIRALAPRTISLHLKDMGVEPHEEGFLLSELPLGEGFIDLAGAIELVRRHHASTRVTLEMITRNPLKVPCLTDKYWVTFPERNGRYLARALRLVQTSRKAALPRVDQLTPERLREVEEENVRRCLEYARTRLGLG